MKESNKIDIDKYDKLPEDGIDLDDPDNNVDTDDTEATTSDDSAKPGTNFFTQHQGSKKKLIAFLLAGLLIIVLICLFANSYMNRHQAPATNTARQSLTSNTANSKFKNEIEPITSAQKQIQEVNNDWRDATVSFAKKRDIKTFKADLRSINSRRITIYNGIKNNKNELAKPVITTSNALLGGLRQSYALTKNSDYQKAIKIYNDTNEQVTDNNRQYKNILVNQLTKRHIQYTTNKTDNGWTVDY